ncbi:MAG TPA: VTT domain-containing protein, partial [Burkholderiales bacterium]|nr:VTT domain-containing protein [Burkholderiales bacterium]
ALLLVRLVPLISFNLVNYAAGLLGVGWWTFLWTTALGILPLTVAMVLLGGQILAAPLWAWALGALVLLVLWFSWRRWQGA